LSYKISAIGEVSPAPQYGFDCDPVDRESVFESVLSTVSLIQTKCKMKCGEITYPISVNDNTSGSIRIAGTVMVFVNSLKDGDILIDSDDYVLNVSA
jgi:hypothetical protein